MKSNLQFSEYKKQFFALAIFGIIVVTGILIFKNFSHDNTFSHKNISFSKSLDTEKSNVVLTEFDPNELDKEQWAKLGFSEKQITTILKYKEIVGGKFTSKEQLKKCYSISSEKFQEIESYILLPEKNSTYKNYKENSNSKSYTKKEIKIYRKFNPDSFSETDWENIGFSERQAAAILKYKNYLGGSFISKEKLKECFIISEDNYRKLEPYLLLPEKSLMENVSNSKTIFAQKKEESKKKIFIFDPNTLDLMGWKSLGFSEKQAQVIINYRNKNLKGSFQNLDEIKNCFVISEEKFDEIKPYIKLNSENFVVRNSSTSNKTFEKTETKSDFSKIDLNQITYKQLIEFGFDEKAAGNLIGFRKKLGGFVNKSQVYEAFDIDRNIAEKLIFTAPLNSSSVEKYTLANAPESWLKTHPYFRYSADKIIFYRITNPDDKKIWKFIKVKPEYEAKMRLYLK